METFYRIVASNPPTLGDFLSYVDLGKPYDGNDPEARRLAAGISVTATLAQARARIRSRRVLGTHVAEVVIPADAAIIAERTGRQRGHYTLWGDPAVLLARVAAVHPAGAVD